MKKKILAVLLAAAMVLSLAACGGNKGTDDKESKKDDTPKETPKVEKQLSDYVGKPLAETMTKIEELNYTATYIADGVDFTEFINDVKDDYLTGEISEDVDKKTAEITLKLASNMAADEAATKLEEKFKEADAWSVANKYGKEQYGDGFDLNYLIGKINASAEDESTWFLKAECTVDGSEMTCEAYVTGTKDSPSVINFIVY